jgi:hypothetical protein
MPTIQINDALGVSLDAKLAPTSALLQYAKDLPGMILQGADLARLKALTLADPAARSLSPKLVFRKPLTLSADRPELTVQSDAGFSFRVLSSGSVFDSDDYGDNVPIPAGQCCFTLGFDASIGAGVSLTSGSLGFGLNASAGVEVRNYRLFSSGTDAPTVAEALAATLGEFVLPARPGDLHALQPGQIATVAGQGTLTLSSTANLLAVANPLATLSLPAPMPGLSLNQTGSVSVGASWKITGEYQLRAQKIDARRFRLGWHRKRGTEISVSASASAGLTTQVGSADLFGTVIAAISGNAQADRDELQRAQLTPEQQEAMRDAVTRAVNRRLELSLAAEFGALREDEAAFLYEIDLDALSGPTQDALAHALRGDLSGVADPDALPPGITEVRSVLTRARARSFSLKINLLGIFNYASVTKLALKGTVTFTPSTGDLVILDQASASRVEIGTVNFGANEEKLRHLMAESFLATAAYRGSRAVAAPPELASSHVFFRIDNSTSRDELRRYLAIPPALGLGAGTPPAGADDFGRTCTLAEATYDDAAMRALFLRAGGTVRTHDEYEQAGRRALMLLIPPESDDAFRLRPMTDDALWTKMKDLGPANFEQLVPAAEAPIIRADYLTIQWWADSMCGTGAVLSRMNALFGGGAHIAPDDARFQTLRNQMAAHLKEVAANAKQLFGEPWGLVAMFLASESRAITDVHITGPRFVYATERPLVAGL